MSKIKTFIPIICTILGVVCIVYASTTEEKQSPIPTKINAEDLCNKKYVIVGRLGKTYGEISTVHGTWVSGDISKPEGPQLQITNIDGVKVDADYPILIKHKFIRLLQEKKNNVEPHRQGEVYDGRVYESGGYISTPMKVDEILRKQPVQDPYGFVFCSFLYLID
jgi:hypothetical protein